MLVDERLFGNTQLIINGLNRTLKKWNGELLVRRNTLGCHLRHEELESNADTINTSTLSNFNSKFEFKNDSDVRMWNIVVDFHG